MSSGDQEIRVLIAGGGTGGHIFPALAIASAVGSLYPKVKLLFVGALGRMEMERVPAAGYQIVGLPIKGMPRGMRPLRLLQFLWAWWRSNQMARKVLLKFRPQVVVGVGGYASVPAVQAAQKLGIPTVLQEQNGYAGKANQLLARKAKRIFVAYEHMERFFPSENLVVSGNPIRNFLHGRLPEALAARRELGLPQRGKILLVMGGSLGAGSINNAVVKNLSLLAQHPDVTVFLQTGAGYYAEVVQAVSGYGGENLKVVDFIQQMDLAYAAADIIVSRAGAISISELCVVGKPTILIPSPNVAEDHQTRNAEQLEQKGAVVMIRDQRAVVELLPRAFALLEDAAECARMEQAIQMLAHPNAANVIAGSIVELAKEELRNE